MRNFPHWIKAYCDYTRDSESPTSFHFWTGVSTVAGALRRRVWISMQKFVWTPNFYIVLVAPAGIVAKSTSIGVGQHLLSQIPGVTFGPESLTWQALTDSLSFATEGVKYTGDDGLEHVIAQSAISVFSGELGTFLSIEDDKFTSFLIRMWDSQEGTFSHKTRGSGETKIDNPWLNLISCTTPSWLSQNFKENMIGGGFTSRIVFVFGETKRMLIPYPDEVIHSDEHRQLESDLVDDLREIALLSGPYHLSAQARVWGREWYVRSGSAPRPTHMAGERYSGYIARKQTHIHKLAMVLAASKRDQRLIEEDDIMEAEAHISATEPDMNRVFASIGLDREARCRQEIIAIVQTYGWLEANDLFARCNNTMSSKEFDAAVKGATRAKLLSIETKNGILGFTLPQIGATNVRSAP
jgi:hypothetical protein